MVMRMELRLASKMVTRMELNSASKMVMRAVPKATVVPVIALLFIGADNTNTVLMAFMISFFPIAVSVSVGLNTLETEYRDILRALGASRMTVFWKIALRSARSRPMPSWI